MKHNILNEVVRLRAARLGTDYKQQIAIGAPMEGGGAKPKCSAPSCGNDATGFCSKCEHTVYCGEACQLKDAKRHASIECEAYQDTLC